MKNAIEIKDLVKTYKEFKLGKINLTIPSGCIIGLIGENGAGKTTLINAILNIININSGNIKIFNKNYKQYEKEIKNDIGVVLSNSFFPEILTPKDINKIMASTYKTWDKEYFFDNLKDFDVPLNKPIKILSKGMKKKLEILTALSHKPKLLILDEPTSDLDPVIRNEILDLFLNFIKNDEHTILLSTHITSDLEHIADKIIFLNEGKIVLNLSRDEIFDDYAVLKCDTEQFSKINKEDIITYKKNKYGYEILIKDKQKLRKKYKDTIIDNITLEELMILIIKGEK